MADKELIPEGDKVKAISFPHDFNAYLIEALKEQQNQIDALQEKIEVLERQLQTKNWWNDTKPYFNFNPAHS